MGESSIRKFGFLSSVPEVSSEPYKWNRCPDIHNKPLYLIPGFTLMRWTWKTSKDRLKPWLSHSWGHRCVCWSYQEIFVSFLTSLKFGRQGHFPQSWCDCLLYCFHHFFLVGTDWRKELREIEESRLTPGFEYYDRGMFWGGRDCRSGTGLEGADSELHSFFNIVSGDAYETLTRKISQ